MKTVESKKLLIGATSEKPDTYRAGWQFLDKETGKTDIYDGERWVTMSAEKDKTKIPDKPLRWLKSPHDAAGASVVAYDGTIWVVYETGKITKITDITDGTAKTEGADWNSDWGEPIRIVVFPDDSFVVFSLINNDPYVGKAYKFSDINDTTPNEVISSTGKRWVNGFGIHHYTNGIGSVLLAAEYDHDESSNDLHLSTDYGDTFSVIHSTPANTQGTNSHFHDVEYDPYNRVIWASMGDGGDGPSKGIWYSVDNGASWERVQSFDHANQPTAIMSFPDRVVFGRDGWNPGFDYLKNPKTQEDWDNLYVRFMSITRPGLSGSNAYIQNAHTYGIEAVMNELLNVEARRPSIVYMTGDGGYSFHAVSIDFTGPGAGGDTDFIRPLWGIDDAYVYGDLHYEGKIIYAEKPKWI